MDAPHFKKPVEDEETINIVGFFCSRLNGYISAKVIVSELGLLPGKN